MNVISTLANPLHKNLRLPIDRELRREGLKLPAGTVVVSADNHWDISEDIFFERLPERFRDNAPRIWKDKIVKFGFPDGKGGIVDPFNEEITKIAAASSEVPGNFDLDVRIEHMDAEGIAKEINFPGFGLAFVGFPDLEMREAMFRVYNEGLAEMQAKTPGRCYAVGVISNWWDGDRAKDAVQQIVDLGFKTMMLPLYPGKRADGTPIIYSEPAFDKLWDAIEESGLPLCFHIGETSMVTGRGGWGVRVMSTISPFVPMLAQLIYGGIFDRNPKLKVVFAEGGIGWVPAALQDAEMIYDSYPGLHSLVPKMRPTEYWAKHCSATFMNDEIGLKLLDYIGVDNVMWAVDYPHAEGSFAYTEGSMKAVLDAVSPDDAKKILGGNAIRVFNL